MNILQALVQEGLITASEMEETKLDKEMISTEELEAIMIELKREEIVKEFLYRSEEISRLFGDAEEEAKKIANSLNHSVADSSNNENTNRNASLINLIIPFARRINQTNDFKLVDALLQELKIKIAELEPSDARPFYSGFVGTDIYPFALFCDVLQYRKRNLHERAIGLCDEFMQLPGVEATNLYGLVLYLRGCCMMDLKRNVEAIIDFTKVISVYQYFRAYISRSVVFQRTGNVEKAFNDVNVAIENNQDVALLFKCRGDLYSKSLKNHELALRDYNQAILLSSDYFSAYQDRARVFLNLKQYDMALADYTRCIKLKPNSIPCLLERAKLLEQLRNIEDARYDYIQILKMDPNNMDVSQRLQQLGSPKSLPSRQESPSRSVTHKVPSPSKQGHLENVRAILQSKL
ncbi:hypothetical protein C9374_002029 [Naegleria lovaniensis]|uniref:Uncharacterized protein n=1 Tax=Naegleria lovaniensis TaxID=51637 RepID=A0AA88KMI1_NAELO|nr:uncharacterized protein C9374_002029 [Naegleria lovaniensis]KAG2386994.1 hypothetical protein C9374_002029 [Naegleria lovaniensis]